MKYATVELSKSFEHRYKFKAYIYVVRDGKYQKAAAFLDTGCFNTMIPRHLAERCGRSLGFKMSYSLGGRVIEAEAFSINKMTIGGFLLERVVAFAGEYPGEYEDDIILGANVINNWEMLINKRAHTFQFREDPPESLPNKAYIYQNYFNRAGNYIGAQTAE
ncbi:hypothetical protein R80B4_02548 [Fibrobacteres bacterium R8-0-B4]